MPRAGDIHPDNLITLCSAHHRAQHRGQLVIEAGASGAAGELAFFHANGNEYGQCPRAGDASAHSQVLRALVNLEPRLSRARGEVSAMLLDLGRQRSLDGAEVERLFREALGRIQPAPARRHV